MSLSGSQSVHHMPMESSTSASLPRSNSHMRIYVAYMQNLERILLETRAAMSQSMMQAVDSSVVKAIEANNRTNFVELERTYANMVSNMSEQMVEIRRMNTIFIALLCVFVSLTTLAFFTL